jgi:glycosyltransferase involved in cell wall biosynthesis
MKQTPPRLFFFSTVTPPFVIEDERLLASHCSVDRIVSAGIAAGPAIVRGVMRADVSFVWFGSVYAALIVFVSRILRRPVIIIAGGVDASKERSIGYGLWLNPLKGWLAGYAFRNASRVLPVSPSLCESVKRLAGYDGGNIRWVPTGFDGAAWQPGRSAQQMVTTVASCWDITRLRAKGIDWMIQAARESPDIRFRIIGLTGAAFDSVRSTAPENVEIVERVQRSDVLPYLQQSHVYCQPSFVEGLPNALCEAMLCGCVPVGTAVGGIPTAIGDAGFLVPYGDTRTLVEALRKAMAAPAGAGLAARERILKEFPLERRERELGEVLREALGSAGTRP